MVVAMIERPDTVAAPRLYACICPCGRFLGDIETVADLPAGMVFTRKHCPNCRDWRVFDAATGKMRHDRDKARRVVK